MNYTVGTKLVMIKSDDCPFDYANDVSTVYENDGRTYLVKNVKSQIVVYFEQELDLYFKVYSDTDKLKKFIK